MIWIAALLVTTTALAAPRLVSVQGKCEIKVTPDRGSLQLNTEKVAPSSATALDEVSKKIDAAKASIQKMNLKDLELRTTHLQLNRHSEWENNKSVFKGFRASLGLEVTTSDIKLLGNVMAEAAKLGLTGTDSFNTFLSLEKSRKEYLKCLDIAAIDAKKKAEQLAKTLNNDIGEVESIIESPAVMHRPQPMMMMAEASMAKSMDAVAPSIEIGDQTFSATVQVIYRLR